jgi:hypothetical protein
MARYGTLTENADDVLSPSNLSRHRFLALLDGSLLPLEYLAGCRIESINQVSYEMEVFPRHNVYQEPLEFRSAYFLSPWEDEVEEPENAAGWCSGTSGEIRVSAHDLRRGRALEGRTPGRALLW